MIDHLSSKLCAAAGLVLIAMQAGTIATAHISEKVRMATSNQIDWSNNPEPAGAVPALIVFHSAT
jgi:hypothetical protein